MYVYIYICRYAGNMPKPHIRIEILLPDSKDVSLDPLRGLGGFLGEGSGNPASSPLAPPAGFPSLPSAGKTLLQLPRPSPVSAKGVACPPDSLPPAHVVQAVCGSKIMADERHIELPGQQRLQEATAWLHGHPSTESLRSPIVLCRIGARWHLLTSPNHPAPKSPSRRWVASSPRSRGTCGSPAIKT